MAEIDVIRFWKDADYRLSLRDRDGLDVPQHPAGDIDSLDNEFSVTGGQLTIELFTALTWISCTGGECCLSFWSDCPPPITAGPECRIAN